MTPPPPRGKPGMHLTTYNPISIELLNNHQAHVSWTLHVFRRLFVEIQRINLLTIIIPTTASNLKPQNYLQNEWLNSLWPAP